MLSRIKFTRLYTEQNAVLCYDVIYETTGSPVAMNSNFATKLQIIFRLTVISANNQSNPNCLSL